MDFLPTDVNSNEVWNLRSSRQQFSPVVPHRTVEPVGVVSDNPEDECTANSVRLGNEAPLPNSGESFNADNPQRRHSRSTTSMGLRRTLSHLAESGHRLLTRGKADTIHLLCSVTLLDGQVISLSVPKYALGFELFSLVTSRLELEETWYFGLSYYPHNTAHPEYSHSAASWRLSLPQSLAYGVMSPKIVGNLRLSRFRSVKQLRTKSSHYMDDVPFWLDLNKRIVDQCKGYSYSFCFEVKYFVPYPEQSIACPKSRYQFILQIRQHLISGRLTCSSNAHVLLGALISQLELGDSHPRHSARSSLVSPTLSHVTSNLSSGNLSQEMRSFSSARTCSLASPEASDEDNSESNIVWHRSSSQPPKYATIGPVNCMIERRASSTKDELLNTASAHLTHSDILPHLRYRTRSAGARLDAVSGTAKSSDHSFRHNWPYPSPPTHTSPAILKRIAAFHRRLRGWPRSKAEYYFLKNVRRFALYGVELHQIKQFTCTPTSKHLFRPFSTLSRRSSRKSDDQWNEDAPAGRISSPLHEYDQDKFALILGIHAAGLLIMWGQVRLAHYPWSRILSVSMKRSECSVVAGAMTGRKQSLYRYTFTFASLKLCSRFFHSFVDYHRCFRLGIHPPNVPQDQDVKRLPPASSQSANNDVMMDTLPPGRSISRSQSERKPNRTYSKWFSCWSPMSEKLSSPPSTHQCPVVEMPECSQSTLGDVGSSFDSRPSEDPADGDPVWVRHSVKVPHPPLPGTVPQTEPVIVHPKPESVHKTHQCNGLKVEPSVSAAICTVCRSTIMIESISAERSNMPVLNNDHSPSNRPKPPPRPKLPPPLAAEQAINSELCSNFVPSNIPIVRTHPCVVDTKGRLVRLEKNGFSTDRAPSLGRNQSFARRSQYGLSNVVPVVPTRTIRYSSVIPGVNQYLLLNTAKIQSVHGNRIPVINTKSIYMPYS